jgi:DNA polymerase-3 subunit gamma/tau
MSDYKALYRKWRSKDFNEVYGQDGITDILKYEVENNKLSHAYLFCGSRGTGKTSCAKILARAVNCLNPKNGNPCNECESCRSILSGVSMDVIEMDAASNNGINDVRDMQDEISFTPAILKYRVYIIDEVHMMSAQAFNALLKTLEEPPEYVIFILATTEYNKLPTTIVSRCQRFDFKRISSDVIIKRLFEIAESEGMQLTEDAARVIARVSRGGMRDAISLLELCAGAHKIIDERLVFDTVGSGNRESAYKIVGAIGESDFDTIYSIIDDIVMKSGDLSVFWQEIIDTYRDIMVIKNTKNAKKYLDLTDIEYSRISDVSKSFSMAKLSYHITILESAMADMQRAFNSKRSIAEIALTRMCDPRSVYSVEALALRVEELEKSISMMKLGVPIVVNEPEKVANPSVSSSTKKTDVELVKKAKSQDNNEQSYSSWEYILERISELKHSLKSGLASAKVYRNGNSFTIYLNAVFYNILSANKNDIELIRGVIAEKEKESRENIVVEIKPLGVKNDSVFSDLDAF